MAPIRVVAVMVLVVLSTVNAGLPMGVAQPTNQNKATPNQDARGAAARRVEARVVCPSCGRPLDRSDGPAAERMRVFIREGLASGKTEDEVVDALVAEYGGEQRVLTDPPRRGMSGFLIWGIPLVVAVLGGVIVAAVVLRWKRR